MKIKRSTDFSKDDWRQRDRAGADFLADKFEEECKRRGVNPEHPRLEGYVLMDGKVPRLAVQTVSFGDAGFVYGRFNRNQIDKAVDFAVSCAESLERQDRREEKMIEIAEQFEKTFEVRRSSGSHSFLLYPKPIWI